MNCTSCSNPLPAGVAFCPICGAAAPYNMPVQGSPSPYDQTEAASSPYGTPSGYPSLPPTIAANGNGYPPQQPQTPYTSYGAGQQANPYGAYNTPPSAYPGGAPPPPVPANPMGAGAYYGQPPAPGYPQGMQQQPGMYGQLPPKKRSKVGLIIGISVLAVVLLCGGILIAATQIGRSTASKLVSSIDATATADAGNGSAATTVPTTGTTNGGVPTAADIVPAAAKILFGAKTSTGVDANYDPTNVTTTLPTNKDVDLVFQVDSAGKNGYIKVRWYEDGQEIASDILTHSAKNNHGYFGQTYTTAGNAAASLSWCTKADCSDEQLAAVVSFTITSTATVPSSNTTVALMDRKQNNA